MAIAGVVAYIPSAYLSVVRHVWVVLAMDSAAFVYVVLLAVVPRFGYRLKVHSLVWLSYLLGVVLLIFTGPFGAGHLFIFAFVFLASLFGSLRQMLLANALAILTHVGFAVASALHLLPWVQNVSSVIVISVNFILVSAVLSFAASYLVRGYSSSAAEERRLRETLEIMLREIEHRVKNNLQVIASLVSIRSRKTEDPARALVEIKESLSAITTVHQLLYRQNDFYLVDLKELLGSLIRRFQSVDSRVAFSFRWEGPTIEIDVDQAVSVGVLINEVVMNSMRHAFGGRPGGRIVLTVSLDPDGRLFTMTVGDDGIGLSQGAPDGGVGLTIIESLVRQLKAEMTRSNDPGLTYRITMRVESPRSKIEEARAAHR